MKSSELLVIANWKMHPDTPQAAAQLFKGVIEAARRLRRVSVVVAPPFTYLPDLKRSYRGKAVLLGAQNISGEQRGAHTGEVSALMVKNAGTAYVIVGHSERRAMGESDTFVGEKVKQALIVGLRVVLCIGEHSRDDHGDYLQFIKQQILEGLKHVGLKDLRNIVIAYEPIWAIGKTAAEAMKPETMHEMSIYIRKILVEKFNNKEVAVPVLYGGSVEPSNAGALLERGEVNGFLVGHASLDMVTFKPILDAAHLHKKRTA